MPGAALKEDIMPIEHLAAGTAGDALTQAAGASAPRAATASPEAVERMQAALSGGQAGAPPTPAPEAMGADLHGPAPAGECAGDKILRGLEGMSRKFEGAVNQVESGLHAPSTGGMDPAELLRMQYSITQVTMEQDLLGKVTGKATSTLDTFLKNQ
ncbi:hypothetical protein JMJ56_18620 [Belnapia sp. T18]|uniref:EscI/YscI/HrpB family type III secretion system inner rod protein n=1 Tax=Belnapia arida TaxID=2804533 RepID=A0ABS1U5U8_9PROT|nr:EscI/YscI/HrpB family type III secretion system inner rod protein [Belnapia arida]MBL6080039.1 hypothetical protein [Belnapia arida]